MTVSVEHIEKTPGVCGGRARIAGHSIRVMDIVAVHTAWNLTAAEIAANYPTITLADVHAALAYYHDHRAEIEADLDDARRCDEFGKTQPSKLRDALAANPVPSEPAR